MLRKLMKHELRATGRIMGPLCLLLLVTAVGANISVRGLLETEYTVLNVLGVLLMVAFALAVAGVCAMSFVLMIQRFYKNLLRDEGYVMMTLPVSVHQHVWSKLLVSVIWFVVAAVAVALSFVIMAYDVGLIRDILEVLGQILADMRRLEMYEAVNGVAFIVEMVLAVFVSSLAACLQLYGSMAVGHSFASHKVLWSVVFYFGIQFALQMLGSVVMVVLTQTGLFEAAAELLMAVDVHSMLTATHAMLWAGIILSVLHGAIFYFLTTYFLKKHLNLE